MLSVPNFQIFEMYIDILTTGSGCDELKLSWQKWHSIDSWKSKRFMVVKMNEMDIKLKDPHEIHSCTYLILTEFNSEFYFRIWKWPDTQTADIFSLLSNKTITFNEMNCVCTDRDFGHYLPLIQHHRRKSALVSIVTRILFSKSYLFKITNDSITQNYPIQ